MSDRARSDRPSARRNDEAGRRAHRLPAGRLPRRSTTSVEAAVALVENGVDVLELGLPYSDPVMDGPVIQAATQQALAERLPPRRRLRGGAPHHRARGCARC